MIKNRKNQHKKYPATKEELSLYSYIVDEAEKTAGKIVEVIESSDLDRGGLIFVTGAQNSGKSIVICKAYKMLKKRNGKKRKVVCSQPEVDRLDVPKGKIYSRSGATEKAVSFKTKKDIEDLFHDYSIVLVDEVHFMPYANQSFFVKEASQFVDRGGWLVVAALRYTSLQTEFLLSTILSERADLFFELTSTCQMCGRKGAKFNQRLVNGRAGKYRDSDLLPPSDIVTYEPRCKDCLVL